jgi:hypothetical protein
MLTHSAGVVAIGPEFSTPEFLFDFGTGSEDFTGGNAFDGLDDLFDSVRGNGLDEKVDMVFIGANLKEVYFVTFADFETHFLESGIHRIRKYHSPILRWADDVVQ